MNTFVLEEKVVLMTGGLGGIATGTATLMLERGAKVFMCDLINESEGLDKARRAVCVGKAAGKEDRVGYARLDVTNRTQFEECFTKCRDMFGTPDVLINAAGVAGETDWERLYDINIKGTHLGIELAFKHMSSGGGSGKGGVVVNLSSTAGITCIGDMFATPAYTASKHAVTAMTRSFGHNFHLKRHGVRVVALAPYFVQTPLIDGDFSRWTDDPEARAAIKEGALGRDILSVEETALKLVNILGANSGSVWMIRPEQLQPFNVPDYKLPYKMGYRSNDSFPKPKLYCGVPI